MVVQTLIAFTLNQALDSYFRDKTKPVLQLIGSTGFQPTVNHWAWIYD